MRIASVADVKAQFSAYLKESEIGPVIITRNGRPVAVLLGVQDEDEIERLILGYTPRLRPIVEAAERRIREGKGSKPEDREGEMETERSETPKPERARPKKRGARKA